MVKLSQHHATGTQGYISRVTLAYRGLDFAHTFVFQSLNGLITNFEDENHSKHVCLD